MAIHMVERESIMNATKNELTTSQIEKAEQCLVDNGIEEDEAHTVLQALCFILLDTDIDE